MSPPRNETRGVVLVGYRGTGKSTVGRALANRLHLPFLDLDLAFEQRHKLPIRSAFEALGEPRFRELEAEILAEIESEPPRVISTGGGVILAEANRLRLKALGTVVWLTADPAQIVRRLTSHPRGLAGRPALTAAGTLGEIPAILAARTPHYLAVADHVVPTDDLSPAQVVEALLAALSPVVTPEPR